MMSKQNEFFAESSWEVEYIEGVRNRHEKKTPIDSVGLYVPAGKAPLPTVSQILSVAAKSAKVPRICVFFPPTTEGIEIIIAANESGADEIYRVGRNSRNCCNVLWNRDN
jgi:sulfopropanediol 3-dehydrogenase